MIRSEGYDPDCYTISRRGKKTPSRKAISGSPSPGLTAYPTTSEPPSPAPTSSGSPSPSGYPPEPSGSPGPSTYPQSMDTPPIKMENMYENNSFNYEKDIAMYR